MDLVTQLIKGRFFNSGNAHNAARGWKGGTIKRGRDYFVKRLSKILTASKVKLAAVKPATLWFSVGDMSPQERRKFGAIIKKELHPTILTLERGYEYLSAWWD